MIIKKIPSNVKATTLLISSYFIFLHGGDEDTESAVKTGQKNRVQWKNSLLSFATEIPAIN